MNCPCCFVDGFGLLELSYESELCDTSGGDFTYRDLYLCQCCGTLFYHYFGDENYEEEIDNVDDVKYLINYEISLSEEDLKLVKNKYLID